MSDAVRDRTSAGGATVLIVEAEHSVRSVTRRMLERCGFRAIAACGCAEALALFDGRRESITGVVLDLGLPGTDAEALFRDLRNARSELPVLFTGGCGQAAVLGRLAGAAETDFLPKPFGLGALGGKAHHLFGAGRATATALARASTPIPEAPA